MGCQHPLKGPWDPPFTTFSLATCTTLCPRIASLVVSLVSVLGLVLVVANMSPHLMVVVFVTCFFASGWILSFLRMSPSIVSFRSAATRVSLIGIFCLVSPKLATSAPAFLTGSGQAEQAALLEADRCGAPRKHCFCQKHSGQEEQAALLEAGGRGAPSEPC